MIVVCLIVTAACFKSFWPFHETKIVEQIKAILDFYASERVGGFFHPPWVLRLNLVCAKFALLLICCVWNVWTIIHDKGKASHFVNLILQKMQKAVKFWWWNCKFMATLTLSNQNPINLVKINNGLKKMKISSNIWSYLWHHYKFEKPGNLFHSNNIKSIAFWAKTIFKLRLFGVT